MTGGECFWCHKVRPPPEALPIGEWWQLPAGWYAREAPYDENTTFVCSKACAVSCSVAGAMLDEFAVMYRQEMGATRRDDERPEETATRKAELRMAQKHGKDWREKTRAPATP